MDLSDPKVTKESAVTEFDCHNMEIDQGRRRRHWMGWWRMDEVVWPGRWKGGWGTGGSDFCVRKCATVANFIKQLHHALVLAICLFESIQLLQISCSNLHQTQVLAIRVFETVQLLQISFTKSHHALVLAILVFESVQLLHI